MRGALIFGTFSFIGTVHVSIASRTARLAGPLSGPLFQRVNSKLCLTQPWIQTQCSSCVIHAIGWEEVGEVFSPDTGCSPWRKMARKSDHTLDQSRGNAKCYCQRRFQSGHSSESKPSNHATEILKRKSRDEYLSILG